MHQPIHHAPLLVAVLHKRKLDYCPISCRLYSSITEPNFTCLPLLAHCSCVCKAPHFHRPQHNPSSTCLHVAQSCCLRCVHTLTLHQQQTGPAVCIVIVQFCCTSSVLPALHSSSHVGSAARLTSPQRQVHPSNWFMLSAKRHMQCLQAHLYASALCYDVTEFCCNARLASTALSTLLSPPLRQLATTILMSCLQFPTRTLSMTLYTQLCSWVATMYEAITGKECFSSHWVQQPDHRPHCLCLFAHVFLSKHLQYIRPL